MTPTATRWLWMGLTFVIVGLVGPLLFGLGDLGSTLLLCGGTGAMVSLLALSTALVRGDRSRSTATTVTERAQPRPTAPGDPVPSTYPTSREPTQDVERAAAPVKQTAAPAQALRRVGDETEAERKQRLDPKNRPANAEVDNTKRIFDPETGRFVDR